MPDEAARALPRLVLSGVAETSPLMRLITARLAGLAQLGATGATGAASGRWRRAVTGTGLQWFNECGHASAHGVAPDGLIVDLHGAGFASPGRIWRIVGSTGAGVLAPFFGVDECWTSAGSVPLNLIESADGGGRWTVLEEVRLSALQSHPMLLEGLARAVAHLLATGIERHAGPISEPRGPAWRPNGRRRRPPSIARFNYRAAGFARRLRDYATCELWAIGVADATPDAIVAGKPAKVSRWIEIPQADGYIADPMPWPGRVDVILCEQFSHGSGRGSLRALTIADDAITANEDVALPVGCHLSYPFAWVEDGRVLCLPEMGASRRQVIYELRQGAPPRPVCVVAENAVMADPTLFRLDGLYWIAYTDGDIGLYDNLCLLWAERLDGPWHPHRANPVKIDVRSSRGAGALFYSGGELIRPAQDCSRTYGGAVVLNRVVECTTAAFREEQAATVLPDPFGRFPDGLHTFSVHGNTVLIDGKRYAVDFGVLRQRIHSRLRRYASRLSRRGRDDRTAPDMVAGLLPNTAGIAAAPGQPTGSGS